MTTITWTIEQMWVKPTDGSFTDVVITAGWRCNGAQTAGTPPVDYIASNYGTCSFPQPAEGGQFTPYADLTQDQVLGWCWANGVDKDSAEAAVAQQIQNQITPPITTPVLPWASPTV